MSAPIPGPIQLRTPGPRKLADGRFDLGPARRFAALPVRLDIEGAAYYVTSDASIPGDYRLLSSICPHLGSEILDIGNCFECPNHGWRFDRQTGRCLTSPGDRMSTIPVQVIDGRLIAKLQSRGAAPSRHDDQPRLAVRDLSIALHAHACLELRHDGFSLLTDPWLVGPAFLGAWTHYPPPLVDVPSLRPDAIWISHEHSDHFHEPTLARFDRAIPIYVPDFPNRRIVERLRQMGFSRVTPMPFGESIEIGRGFRLTCYEPGSLWNDAVVLIEVDGLRLLNLNDAGLNRRIAGLVAPVDVIASSFSPGASGYPLTWTHLDDRQKTSINERARQGILRMLKEAVAMYGSQYVLPYAGHFALWHPSHAKYVQAMRKNTVDDVVRAFEGESARVIDLLPGEAWNVNEDRISRKWKRRERLYGPDRIAAYLRRTFDRQTFEAHHPTESAPTREQVEHYFLGLNRTAEIAFCEDLSVTVRVTDEQLNPAGTDVGLEIRGGALRVLHHPEPAANLLIEIPGAVLHRVITENLSWDEAHIGYWCRFSRQPDVFHAGFWRLLQAPYFCKPPGIEHSPSPMASAIHAGWVIADILEKFGERAERIIRRYGLYCGGCSHSTADTLGQGARQHGLDDAQLQRLLRELNEALPVAA